MIRRLYDWTLSLVDHPRAIWALAVIAFVESSFFPIPPDLLMIPMILAAPHRAWLIAGVALVSSVLGGLFEFAVRFNDLGFWAVLTAGITPFPYKVITIMSGWTGMPLGVFMATSVLARGLRFFIVAGLL